MSCDVNFIRMINKTDTNYAVPFSHKTFEFGNITLDSNFDSGNLYNAERINNQCYNIWIAIDHPKNQYRTWFHFSLAGLRKGALVTFNIKNMQNQSKLINLGLVPVFREENCQDWKRIAHKIDLSKIEYNEGWIEWTFKHTMTSDEKVFFAFFYPWSNIQNNRFLQAIEDKCKLQDDIYFKRSTIIKSLQGRPVEFITISSKKGLSNRSEPFQDDYLFPEGGQPKQFISDKKSFIIGARVHPGQVPSSHVMTGIIEELSQDSDKARLLRDKFVFYLFPIFNPDGVARGAYRVDPNGINLNRCYINPNPKTHSPIYAVKKVIMHFHHKNKYFGFLDLHAHAARKGVFIYGNSTNELDKQTQICLFPKILSMNSQIFEYQGSNFTQSNMYCKDINDHVSKQGAGRVALFKATKNPYSWTLQCNYNMSRVINVLEPKRNKEDALYKINQKQLDSNLIVTYKSSTFKQPKQFYTIQGFRRLGKEICQSLLDLIQLNPQSRIDNPNNYYKCVQNLKLNLAVALLRMAPNRFESPYKKIYHYLEGATSSKELSDRSVKALYFLLVKNAKIQNLTSFLKDSDDSSVVMPSKPKRMSMSPVRQQFSPKLSRAIVKPGSKQLRIRMSSNSPDRIKYSPQQNNEDQQLVRQNPSSILKLKKIPIELQTYSNDSEEQCPQVLYIQKQPQPNIVSDQHETQKQAKRLQSFKINSVLTSHLIHGNMDMSYQKVLSKNHQIGLDILRSYRKSFNNQLKKFSVFPPTSGNFKLMKSTVQELPMLATNKIRALVSIASLGNEVKIIKKKNSVGRDIFAND